MCYAGFKIKWEGRYLSGYLVNQTVPQYTYTVIKAALSVFWPTFQENYFFYNNICINFSKIIVIIVHCLLAVLSLIFDFSSFS
jgi:hypothetical protein